MDTRFLESFVAVVEHGSLAGAARRLDVTPAAVAQRIKALEGEFGVALVTRAGRTVQPTATGREVFDRARPVLAELRALAWAADGSEPGGQAGRQAPGAQALRGVVRLGAISTALTGLLPDILARLSLRQPRIEVHVAPGTSRDLYGRVVEGDLDLALVVEPPFALPKAAAWHPVREEPLLVIAPEALAASLARSGPEPVLREQPLIRYDRRHWGGRLADAYLRGLGLAPRERFELDALEAIAVMVDRGLGVSIVPDWAPPWPAGLALARWVVPDIALRRRIGFVWLKGSPGLRLVEALLAETA